MKDTKHTPGPRVGSRAELVQRIHGQASRIHELTAQNAELLAALRALLDMPMIVCVPPIPGPTAFTTIDKARALLARVEGGAK